MSCPDPRTCPVDRARPRYPRSAVLTAGRVWYNVSRHRDTLNSSGRRDNRFSPLRRSDGQVIPHVYLAQNHLGALLESALHDTWGAQNRVQRSDLEGLSLRAVACRTPVRVVDLRDDQLKHYGMTREQIVAAPSEHYSCTRAWALRRSRLNIGGHATAGFIWNSRQAEIAADYAAAALRVLLTVSEQTGHVAVVYDHEGVGDALFESSVIYADLSHGAGLAFVRDVATAVGLFVED